MSDPEVTVTVVEPVWPRWIVRFGATVAVLLVAISLTTAVLYLAPAVSRLTDASERGATERAQLQDELTAAREAVVAAQSVDDCRDLYYDDVRVGSALSQIALSNLFAAIVEREPAVTDADRAAAVEDNRRLVAQLEAANDPLRAAVAALEEYRAIDPPPDKCPHPNGG